jgi:hypothetical protein
MVSSGLLRRENLKSYKYRIEQFIVFANDLLWKNTTTSVTHSKI